MVSKKYFNKELVTYGLGTLAGLFGSMFVKKWLSNKTKWATELAGVIIVIIASMMMAQGSSQTKKVATGIGAIGVALATRATFSRITGTSVPQLQGKGKVA